MGTRTIRLPAAAAGPSEGGSVARAKHTGRSEARRKYRQAMSQPVEGDDLEPTAEEAASEPAGRERTAPARAARSEAPAAPRPGITSAFRAAYHAPNVRADLRELP